jgi:hypothetical protein
MASTSNETNSEAYESAEKKLNDLMKEYLALKQIGRKVCEMGECGEKKVTNFISINSFFLLL